MKIAGITFGYLAAIYCVMTAVGYTWEDHPDIEDHKETDRLLKLANAQTGANEYEWDLLVKEEKETLRNFKSSKFKKKEPK